MGWCTAVLCKNHCERVTQFCTSPSEEREEENRKKTFGRLAVFWFGTFAMLFRATGHVVGHEALENESYIVIIKGLQVCIFEILRGFHYHILRVCIIPHTYRV